MQLPFSTHDSSWKKKTDLPSIVLETIETYHLFLQNDTTQSLFNGYFVCAITIIHRPKITWKVDFTIKNYFSTTNTFTPLFKLSFWVKDGSCIYSASAFPDRLFSFKLILCGFWQRLYNILPFEARMQLHILIIF